MPAKGKYDTVYCYTHIHMGMKGKYDTVYYGKQV